MPKYINPSGLPQYVVDALIASNDEYRRSGDYSATQLYDPPQMVALRRKHWDNVVVDVASMQQAFIGRAVHAQFEKYNDPNAIIEAELIYTFVVGGKGYKISGRTDRYTHEHKIEDIKTTTVWSFLYAKGVAKPEWIAQCNVNALLARLNGFPVRGLEVHAFLLDWKQNEARFKPEYPQARFHRVVVPEWSEAKTRDYICERVGLFERAHAALSTGARLQPCSSEDRWERDHCWAVYKKGGKKAMKICPTIEMAQAFTQGHKDGALLEIKERHGEQVRCANWCSVAQFCDQWAELRREENNIAEG